MNGVCRSVACQYEEFAWATLIGIGEIGLPPASGLKRRSHSSL